MRTNIVIDDAAKTGVDVFRVFDALNDIRNVEVAAPGARSLTGDRPGLRERRLELSGGHGPGMIDPVIEHHAPLGLRVQPPEAEVVTCDRLAAFAVRVPPRTRRHRERGSAASCRRGQPASC